MKYSIVRKTAFALAAMLSLALVSSCTIQDPNKYSGLSELSAPNAKHNKNNDDGEESQGGKKDVSITDLPATFSEAEYIFDPKTGKLIAVSSPDMYTSKIPDTYTVSGYSSRQSETPTTSTLPESSKPPVPTSSAPPAVPTTGSTGEIAELSSAQRQKLITLISSDLLDNVSFESESMTVDHMLAAGLLLGQGEIEQGFDTCIDKDTLVNHCRDLFGKSPIASGSKVSSSYVTLKGDKFYIKKMPESNYYSKSVESIYDLGNGYYKVTVKLSSDGKGAGSAIYIVQEKTSAANGFVIIAQKIN